MKIDDWRKSKSLTRWWATVLNTEEGKAFTEMMAESHIRHIQGRGLEPGQELGQIQGYDICMNNVEKAALLIDTPAPLAEPSYEQDDTEELPTRKKRNRK